MLTTLSRRPLLVLAILAFLVAAWAAFRPELLFVNKSVNEPFPAVSAPSSSTTSVNK